MNFLSWQINAAMNPSSVLSNGAPNADMASDPELRTHLRECMLEVFRGAEAVLGLKKGAFPPKGMATPDAILTSTERNKGGRPSMLGDWERGSRMELEVSMVLSFGIYSPCTLCRAVTAKSRNLIGDPR